MIRRDKTKQAVVALIALIFAMSNAVRAEDRPKSDPTKKCIVGILIFEDVEVLDFCGPYEVFTFAHIHTAAPADAPAGTIDRMENLFDVRVVAATTDPVAVRGGLKVIPTDSFNQCPQVDILVVPGGRGKDAALKDKALLAWVSRQAGKAELVTSVCTGSFILAEVGLLDNKKSATHQMSIKNMQAKYPKVKVIAGQRVVEDGNFVSAAGVSSGLDMSLRVVSRLCGDEVSQRVSRIIEYPHPASQN